MYPKTQKVLKSKKSKSSSLTLFSHSCTPREARSLSFWSLFYLCVQTPVHRSAYINTYSIVLCKKLSN